VFRSKSNFFSHPPRVYPHHHGSTRPNQIRYETYHPRKLNLTHMCLISNSSHPLLRNFHLTFSRHYSRTRWHQCQPCCSSLEAETESNTNPITMASELRPANFSCPLNPSYTSRRERERESGRGQLASLLIYHDLHHQSRRITWLMTSCCACPGRACPPGHPGSRHRRFLRWQWLD